MSRYKSDPELGYENPSACTSFLRYTWKAISCLFSHITLVSLVVSYCVLGAFTFKSLEVEHEKDVKRNISKIRKNTTEFLWTLTTEKTDVLKVENFTEAAATYLEEFERRILRAMTEDGWDGEEDINKVQWTITGALFYSIVVITTIGYGHICPKTTWGKIVTIFYAILGIPLMLLCLSNLGDIMATSFRFLYWRVCCYVCTKKPKKRARSKSFRAASRAEFSRNRHSFRRSMRGSGRSADSGFAFSDIGPASHSDTDLRYIAETDRRRGSSLPRGRKSSPSRKISAPGMMRTEFQRQEATRGYSLDRKKPNRVPDEIELDPILVARIPILCNKYVVGKDELKSSNITGITTRTMEGMGQASPLTERRAVSMPRTQRYLEPPGFSTSDPSDDESTRSRPRRKRSRSPMPVSSPKMMTPLGYGHRSKYLDDPDSDEDWYEDGYYDPVRQRIKPVPIWLCVFLVVSYILAGAFLFDAWEGWGFLNSAYFCFITLTTIGFGDLVPAKGVRLDKDEYYATSIALCSLYLLFGIALLAMSFNLVQEEVISNVKSVAKSLGIIKADSEDSEDDS